MPPRYVYWTIIVDGQPTAFRSGSLEDIMPTFNRLKEKQPTAELKWFQNGQLWPSRHDAQDFAKASTYAKAPADKPEGKPERAWNAKPEWKTRTSFAPRGEKPSWKPKGEKPEWVPKGVSTPRPPAFAKAMAGEQAASRKFDDRPASQARGSKPEWKPKGTFKPKEAGHASAYAKASADKQAPSRAWSDQPAWKPKGAFKPHEAGHRPSARDQARSSFKPKSYTPKGDDQGATRSARAQSRGDKLDWKPASAKATARQTPVSRGDGPNAGFAKSDPDAPKRKWVPKAEYKKSLGIEVKKDSKWRPGGDHVDPKQKYKDAKKAKWGRVKATIRARSSKPRKRED